MNTTTDLERMTSNKRPRTGSPPADPSSPSPGPESPRVAEVAKNLDQLQLQVQTPQSQGDPNAPGSSGSEGSGGGNDGIGSPDLRRLKGILKNKDQRSPLAPGALNYNGPVEADQGMNILDNNYEEDMRFSKLVDSKELYAKKVKAGLTKKRRRNTTIESAPELTFRPKRQDDEDDGDDPEGGGGKSPSYKPPLTV